MEGDEFPTRAELWADLRKSWKEAYPLKAKKDAEKEVVEFYNATRHDLQLVSEKITYLKWLKKNRSNPIAACFAKQMTKANVFLKSPVVQVEDSCGSSSDTSTTVEVAEYSSESSEEDQMPAKKIKDAPKQASMKRNIADINSKIAAVKSVQAAGMATDKTQATLKSLIKDKREAELKLNRLKSIASAVSRTRKKKADKLLALSVEHPEVAAKLRDLQPKPVGRPRLEEAQPKLLDTIVDIVSHHTSAEPKRRDESLRTCRTLDDLRLELMARGFTLSRSSLYLRLIPRRWASTEGKKHVKTVPVRLIRAQNDGRHPHPDKQFTMETIENLRELAEVMGEKCVFALSQDDRARVPLGLPAANKQVPILMNMMYRVRLPDHDWVVATRHKLIPSVYAGLAFDEKGRVSYSGPTFIAIRSGKHDSSTAFTHLSDFIDLINIEDFKKLARTESNEIKPIVTIFVDGGPDENPRYEKPLLAAIHHFVNFNLDAIFVSCFAPHQSAYNPVERWMSPLSKDLSGIILPHDHYGSHLGPNGATVDRDLEVRNFERAGNCLAEVWNESEIDGYPVRAVYVPPGQQHFGSVPDKSENWKSIHVRQSQYLIQVVKCGDIECCGPLRSNLKDFLRDGFLPAPLKYKKDSSGVLPVDRDATDHGAFLGLSKRMCLQAVDPKYNYKNKSQFPLPYDYFCPTVNDKKLEERMCKECGLYFASKKSKLAHEKMHRVNPTQEVTYFFCHLDSEHEIHTDNDDLLEICSDNDDPLEIPYDYDNDRMHIIQTMSDWYVPSFEEV